MYNGIINVYKEKGYTSHDVVAKLRGILRQKKIGHTGTLDPDATGVLPVCLGAGTRLCDMITDKTKAYETVFVLGKATDTQDISGTVTSSYDGHVPLREFVSDEQIREAIVSFVGDYEQLPPMYSAVKVNGKKLYELAREGKEIERKTRLVQIHSIEILGIDFPRVSMRVKCSKGTYIRTLCHDIGLKLGVYGCMEELVRISSGPFVLEKALKLSEIEAKVSEAKLDEYIVPVEKMFEELDVVQTKPEFDKILYNGNPMAVSMVFKKNRKIYEEQEMFRVYDSNGVFRAVYTYEQKHNRLKAEKMFL